MKETVIKTKRLLLTPMTDDELSVLIEKEDEPHLKAAYTEMLVGSTDHPEDRLFYTAWKIAKKEAPDESIGNFSFMGTPVRGQIEIGYGIDEPYRGNGYMTEAVKRIVEWAFEQPGVYSVAAECEEDNAASRRVLEKSGFEPDGMGEEGPRFLHRKPDPAYLSLYLSIGLCLGVSFGTLFDNLAIGISIGMGLGVCLGAAMDAREKKIRAAVEHPEKADEKKNGRKKR